MLSIRFEGLDREKPFVDASVTSRPLTAADLPVLMTTGLDVFGAFRPGRLRIWSAAPMDRWTAEVPGARPDRRVLAEPLRELQECKVPDDLTLRPTRDLTHYADAVTAYAAVDAEHPSHVGQARIMDEDDLREVIEAGTMFDVIWRDQWSGYVGALPKPKHGLPTYSIQEMLLAPTLAATASVPTSPSSSPALCPTVGGSFSAPSTVRIAVRGGGVEGRAARRGRLDLGAAAHLKADPPDRVTFA